jgi:hypothetical protein
MVITIDLPEDIVAAIDKAIAKRPEEPKWPFPKRAVKFSRLSYKDREKLETYQKELRAYQDYPALVKPERGSRSAIVEELLRLQLKLPISPVEDEEEVTEVEKKGEER